ncbi:cytochrome P450 6k1-like [Trichogramma pretiosum]|uniref:cytochrome P450 6k1-like n=1 Tax=Trichogramma pretiosum TaxID=7493 RepID=UPI000C7190B8|nr:cytochrome P450 6k1-like [Trichogramma pretiosum]
MIVSYLNFVLPAIFASLFTVVVFFYFYTRRNFGYWKKRNVPTVWPPRAFFGNFGPCLFMQQSAESFFHELYKAADGELLVGYWVFDKPHVMIRDPELIKHVLVKDFDKFSDRLISSSKSDAMGNNNMFLLKEPAWKPLRQTMSKFFTSGKMKKVFERMPDVAADLDNYLDNLGLKDEDCVIDITEMCYKFALDLIGVTTYGINMNSLTIPDAQFREKGRIVFSTSPSRHFENLCMFFYPPLTLQLKNSKTDFLDLLVDLKNKEISSFSHKTDFSDNELVAQAAIFYTAGFGTTSTTIMFALYELSKQPEIQIKLQREIQSALNLSQNKCLSYDMVQALPYLDAVVWETLRIYPTVMSLDRISMDSYRFPGTNITIDKGTPVSIPLRALQMDSRYFANPDKFNPDNFYGPSNKSNIIKYTFLPFGDGPHICIGMRLGLMVVKYGLAYLMSKYTVEQCKETVPNIGYNVRSVFLSPSDSIVLKIKKIK